jgi:multidrug efflux pump subunit AcrA (membrane-fusion protein)
MHRFDRARELVLGTALVVLLGTGQALGDDSQPKEMPPAPVQAAQVVEREVAAGRTFVGTVMAERTSTVGADVEGQVVELLAREGDRVEQGAPLAKLRTHTAELVLAGARADLASTRAQLDELENGARPEEIEQARARLASAEAERAHREWLLASTKKMLDTAQVSEDAYQQALATSRKAVADVAVAAAALALLEQGPRKERILGVRCSEARDV